MAGPRCGANWRPGDHVRDRSGQGSSGKPNLATAGVERFIDLREGDGCEGLLEFAGRADLVFIDSEKRDYVRLLGPAIEALRKGGLLVADNLTTHASELEAFRVKAGADSRISGLVVPLGGGEFVAVRL